MAIANGARRWYDSSDSDDDTPRKENVHAAKGKPSPLKQALRNDALSNARHHHHNESPAVETPNPRMERRSNSRDDEDEDGGGSVDSPASVFAPSPAGTGDTPSPYAHLSRLSRPSGAGGHVGSHLLPIPAWSPGLRGRTARNREVLLVARNAREQAKVCFHKFNVSCRYAEENEFLRTRVRDLEDEIAEGSERVGRVRAALDAGERAVECQPYVEASADSVRQLEDRLEGAKGREVALKAEAAAHAAAAEQLTLELERMRAIEEQTSLEAAALIQKTSRLQNELNASARQAAIAEEMLVGVQVEGDRALEASEHAMMELQRRLHELEAESSSGGAEGAAGSSVAGGLSALLDQAMGEAAALREAVASAASEAGRWRAEASRMEKAHGDTALERSYEAACAELKELREENAFMRSDLMALHSGFAAEEEAMGGCGGGGGGVGDEAPGKQSEVGGVVVGGVGGGGGGGGGVGRGGGGSTPARKGGSGQFSSPARSAFKKQLNMSNMSKMGNLGGEVLDVGTSS